MSSGDRGLLYCATDPLAFPAADSPPAPVLDTACALRIYRDTAGEPELAGELRLPREERISPRAVRVKDGTAYLATGRDGLRVVDVRDPSKPALLGHFYDLAINRMATVDVQVVGSTAYVADLDNGLYVLDVSDPRQPRQLALYHTPNAHSVDVTDGLALVADGVYGARVLDVGTRPAPASSEATTPRESSSTAPCCGPSRGARWCTWRMPAGSACSASGKRRRPPCTGHPARSAWSPT